jgi:hypothetical protein
MKASSLAKAEIAARMVLVRRLRKMASLCRQQAAYNPAQSWKLLAEAEYWERLARAEVFSHFKDCHTTSSSTELAA